MNHLVSTDYGHRFIAWCGFYELELSRRLSRLASSGGILLDVGANVGYFSILWASRNRNNRVLAFEASPRNHAMLHGNVQVNGLHDRVVVYPFAIGETEGRLAFDLGPVDQSGWGGLTRLGGRNCVQVDVKTLDQVLPSDVLVDVLKVDTEGADAWVLKGGKSLLQQHRVQHVFYEENRERMKRLGIAPSDARVFLEDCGYRVEPFGDVGHSTEFHAFPK